MTFRRNGLLCEDRKGQVLNGTIRFHSALSQRKNVAGRAYTLFPPAWLLYSAKLMAEYTESISAPGSVPSVPAW